MSNNNVLFESSSNSVSDIQLSDDMALIYTDSSLEGLFHTEASADANVGEFKLHYREITTGATITKVIHQESYSRDYAPASLKILPMGELWVTSYRKSNGSPWLSAWKFNQANEFEQVFDKQLAPLLGKGYSWLTIPHGGSHAALEQLTRQQFISLAKNPINKNEILVSFPAPSLGVNDDTPLSYLDSFNVLTSDDLTYISTVHHMAGVDVIAVKVDTLGNQIGSDILGTTNRDEHFGVTSYQGKALVFGRARTINAQWDAYIATPGMASSSFSLNSSSVITAATATKHGLLASGTVGWSQNPHGISISEHADVELILVSDKLNEISKLTLPSSARFDRIFGFMPLKKNVYLAYGMENGPGTHSADNDINQLVSSPLMMQVTIENGKSISHVVF